MMPYFMLGFLSFLAFSIRAADFVGIVIEEHRSLQELPPELFWHIIIFGDTDLQKLRLVNKELNKIIIKIAPFDAIKKHPNTNDVINLALRIKEGQVNWQNTYGEPLKIPKDYFNILRKLSHDASMVCRSPALTCDPRSFVIKELINKHHENLIKLYPQGKMSQTPSVFSCLFRDVYLSKIIYASSAVIFITSIYYLYENSKEYSETQENYLEALKNMTDELEKINFNAVYVFNIKPARCARCIMPSHENYLGSLVHSPQELISAINATGYLDLCFNRFNQCNKAALISIADLSKMFLKIIANFEDHMSGGAFMRVNNSASFIGLDFERIILKSPVAVFNADGSSSLSLEPMQLNAFTTSSHAGCLANNIIVNKPSIMLENINTFILGDIIYFSVLFIGMYLGWLG